MYIKIFIVFFFLSWFSLVTLCTQKVSNIKCVWAIDDCEKIKRTDLNNPLLKREFNSVWNGSKIRLFSGRNEIIGFQIVIEADNDTAKNVDVHFDSLWNTKFVIKNNHEDSNPLQYVGKYIELFREHYISVFERTSMPSVWWPHAKSSDYYQGDIPDGLVPFEVGKAKGGAPFDIPARTNQTVWCDIYISRNAYPGLYRGNITIFENSTAKFEIPVELVVYNFVLPDSNHLHNFFFINKQGIISKHGVQDFSEEFYTVEREYHKMAHRHRMDLSFNVTIDSLDKYYKGYFTGEYYTKGFQYEGPGYFVGNGTYSIGTYDQPDGKESGFYPSNKTNWVNTSNDWVEWFNKYAPSCLIFKYMQDEPDTNWYESIRLKSRWIHDNSGPGKYLPIFCTLSIDTQLIGYIDIWAMTGQSGYIDKNGKKNGLIVQAARERKQKGEKIAIYNGTRPSFGPLSVIDTDAADARINPWIAWRYSIDLYFLWFTNLFHQQDRKLNPWVDNYLVFNGYYYWGGGAIFYPGQDKEFPSFDRGIPGPIASIRMKNWRRGQQDYEYMWLLFQLKGKVSVDSLVNNIVPYAFDECPQGQNEQPPWATRGYQFERVRKKIAELISQ